MVSQIKVNEIIKQSGSSISIGESGDTINIGTTGDTINLAGSAYAAAGANTPAFHASMPSDSSVANTTYTTLPCSTELYDTDSTYNNSTYVFTPATSGKYFIYAQTKPDTSTDFNDSIIKIKKNGTDIIFYARRNTNSDSVSCCGVVEANTTDYFHAEYYQASGGTINIQAGSGTRTFFGAYKIIGA
jgi:hypothetical protein